VTLIGCTFDGGRVIVDESSRQVESASSATAEVLARDTLDRPVLVQLPPATVAGAILEGPEVELRPGDPGFVRAALERLPGALVV
jgi:hypothetical protein